MEEKKRNIANPGIKTIYIITAILTPLIGAMFGVFSSFCIAVGNMYNTEYKPDYYSEAGFVKLVSEASRERFITEGIIRLTVLGFVFLAGVVILCVLTGRFGRARDENGVISGPEGIQLSWFDRMWTELNLVLFTLATMGTIGLCVPIVETMPYCDIFTDVYIPLQVNDYYCGISNKLLFALCGAGMAVCIALMLLCLVSMIKKIKARQFLNTTLIVIIIKKILKWIETINQRLSVADEADTKAGKKLIIKYGLIVIALIMISSFYSPLGLIIALAAGIYFVSEKIARLMEIRNGVVEVRKGNLDYKLPFNENENGPINELDKLASDINQISQATNLAVQNEIKNQRMKADLISNVSHDLKTPLTSMLSYVDILKKEGLDSPKAAEYLAIIDEKTTKLKSLTEDLFEAAKASSGSIPCEITEIDLSALIDQELAELSDALDKNKLKLIKTCKTKNTRVYADGKLLSRVIENILVNAAKYALPKSRVYVDISELNCDRKQLLLEIKNVSKEQLNISPDELMERFTRGDDSRNTEGSGLGLAIAKDLTRIMGGSFEIKIDGDMFKATVLLNQA